MKKYLGYVVTILTVILARLIPVSYMVGSMGVYFSCTTTIAPVIARHMGLSWITLFLVTQKSMTLSVLLLHLIRRLPLLGAAYAYKSRHWFISVIIPVLCMLLFVMHDIGRQAWPYAMYWLIPVVLWFAVDSIWSRALIASFVAHGLGSVICLYAGDIPVATWMGLIPIVIIERLLMAGGIVLCEVIIVEYQGLCAKVAQRMYRAGWL